MNIFIICDSFQKRVFFLLKYAKNLCLIAEEIKKATFDTAFSPIV